MNNGTQTLFCGLTSVLLVVAVFVLFTGVKKAMRKILKGGKKHDDK